MKSSNSNLSVDIVPLRGLSKATQRYMTDGLKEAARVWNFSKNLHYDSRKTNSKWPTGYEIMKQAKDCNFQLLAQTVQQIVNLFYANIKTAKKNRKEDVRHNYPYRDLEIFPIIWTRQSFYVEDEKIILPMGRGRKSIVFNVSIPKDCKCVKLVYNDGWFLHVCKEIPIQPNNGVNRAAIDLGQIHQGAVVVHDVKTNTSKALLVSGRRTRSLKSQNKHMLKKTNRLLKKGKKDSNQYKKIKKSQVKQSARNERRIKDTNHKGINKMVKFLQENDVKEVYIGDPTGVRYKDAGRKQNQNNNTWETGKGKDQLEHELKTLSMLCFIGGERGTSSKCPICGFKHKVKGRDWVCPQCGFKGHRDVVGGVNMFPLAYNYRIPFPTLGNIQYLQPIKVGQPTFIRSSNRADTPQSPSGRQFKKKRLES